MADPSALRSLRRPAARQDSRLDATLSTLPHPALVSRAGAGGGPLRGPAARDHPPVQVRPATHPGRAAGQADASSGWRSAGRRRLRRAGAAPFPTTAIAWVQSGDRAGPTVGPPGPGCAETHLGNASADGATCGATSSERAGSLRRGAPDSGRSARGTCGAGRRRGDDRSDPRGVRPGLAGMWRQRGPGTHPDESRAPTEVMISSATSDLPPPPSTHNHPSASAWRR